MDERQRPFGFPVAYEGTRYKLESIRLIGVSECFVCMIVAKELTKVFSRRGKAAVRAANGVSFQCRPGEIYGLLGANGAGKTTTLRMLATILRPTSGTAVVAGADVCRDPRAVRSKIGFLSTATALYGRLTAEEMITYFGRLHGMAGANLGRRTEELLDRLDMNGFRNRRCDHCSTGMKQRISIARALIHDPEVMIFDEPTVGLDVFAARQILRFIRECRDQGKTVIFSTHIMTEAEKLCNRIGVIHDGEIKAEGTVTEIRARYEAPDLEEAFVRVVGVEEKGGVA